MDFNTLLLNILKSIKGYKNGILITRLIKIAYLVEVFYYRKNGSRLTDAPWVYYKYGPYIMDIESRLNDNNIISEEIEDRDLTKYTLKEYVTLADIPTDLKLIISSTIKRFIDVELSELLDYVYYETEPMINADKRGEILDFSTVLPSDYYKVKKIECSSDVVNEIKMKYKSMIKNVSHI